MVTIVHTFYTPFSDNDVEDWIDGATAHLRRRDSYSVALSLTGTNHITNHALVVALTYQED